MAKVILRKSNRERRKLSIRKNLSGNAEKPRISVFRSNKFVYAQLIDDTKGKTLVASSTLGKKTPFAAGKELAEKALGVGVKKAVFDRNGYKYHGRVKSLVEGVRRNGRGSTLSFAEIDSLRVRRTAQRIE